MSDYATKTGSLKAAKANMSIADVGKLTSRKGINVTGGNVVISDGVLTFEDLIDGTTIDSNGASGYKYFKGIPASFNNGVCYDIGEMTNNTDLSAIRFSASGKLVQTCEIWFTTSSNAPTGHKWPAGLYWIDSSSGAAPSLLASKNYRIVLRQEPSKIIASIAYLY